MMLGRRSYPITGATADGGVGGGAAWAAETPIRYPDPHIKVLDPRFQQYVLGNAAIDAAFDRVRHSANDAEYTQAIAGLQQAFMDDPPGIFLAWSVRARAISKRFTVPPSEPGRDILATLRLWKPAADGSRTSHD